jgi:hypothetical protein
MILDWLSSDCCAVPLMNISAGRSGQVVCAINCKTNDQLVRLAKLPKLGRDVGPTNRKLLVYRRSNADKLSIVLECHRYKFALFFDYGIPSLSSKIRTASFMTDSFCNADSV